jgi:hypothetical protein
MPHDANGAFMKQGSDSSPRLRLLSSSWTPLPGQTVSVTEGDLRRPDDPDIRVHIAESARARFGLRQLKGAVPIGRFCALVRRLDLGAAWVVAA